MGRVTSIGTISQALQIAAPPSPAGSPATASLLSSLESAASRDAQIGDLPATSAGVNQLQSLASASSSASAIQPSAIPAPTLPTTQQQTQAQAAAALPPLKGDFYADGDDAA